MGAFEDYRLAARRGLESGADKTWNTLNYYAGPTGIPNRLAALMQALDFTDAGDLKAVGEANRDFAANPSVNRLSNLVLNAAAASLPFVGARMMNNGMGVIDDAIASGRDDVGRFAGDESGAIRAWHGSPHDFDRFSLDKIGTGEGAQAYGHGLYFAEAQDTAKAYQGQLASGFRIDGKPYNATTTKAGATTPGHHAADALDRFKGDRAKAVEWLRGGGPTDIEAANLLESAKDIEPWNGRLYEVEIDANPEDFLDWDAPLSEQSPNVRESVQRAYGNAQPVRLSNGRYGMVRTRPDGSGDKVYGIEGATADEAKSALQEYLMAGKGSDLTVDMGHSRGQTPVGASEALRNAGVKGIRYFDQGSRPPNYGPYVQDLLAQAGSKEKALEIARQRFDSATDVRTQIKAQEAIDALSIPQTRNYVVFDDKIINIVSKLGIAGAAGYLGLKPEEVQAGVDQHKASRDILDYLDSITKGKN